MSKSKKKRSRRRRRSSSKGIKDFSFVDCPVAGATVTETRKGNCLHVFDSIGFIATDINHECFEVEGLRFDQDGGWFEKDAVVPKYYGKDVYEACMEYAVDRGIKDSLYLGLALLGQKRPAKCVLMLSHSKIIRMMKEKTGHSVVIFDEKNNMKIA